MGLFALLRCSIIKNLKYYQILNNLNAFFPKQNNNKTLWCVFNYRSSRESTKIIQNDLFLITSRNCYCVFAKCHTLCRVLWNDIFRSYNRIFGKKTSKIDKTNPERNQYSAQSIHFYNLWRNTKFLIYTYIQFHDYVVQLILK